METRHRELLRTHRLWLSEQLLVSDSIVPFLFQEDILTQTQVEVIECQQSSKHRVLKLLDILPTRGPLAFSAFIRSLRDFRWVRDRLETELDLPGGPAPTAGTDVVGELPLHRVPSDRELSRLASVLGSQWPCVLLELGVSAEELYACRADHVLDTHGAALEGLLTWRRAQGRRATVDRLLQALQAADIHPSVLQGVLS